MPSIYNFRHVELDKVGRGKSRVVKNGESTIFEAAVEKKQNGSSGSCSETESVDGSVFSCPSTPVHGIANNSFFGYDSDNFSTPSSSASSSRRGSLQETKNRLFGQEEEIGSPRRHLVNRMKSNIFQEPEPAPVTRVPVTKKYEHVIHRNPITGQVLDGAATATAAGLNGRAAQPVASLVAAQNVNGSNGSQSLPNTPTRTRQPPGGKSSNIFG